MCNSNRLLKWVCGLFIFFLYLPGKLNAQPADSLYALLKSTRVDSVKAELLIRIAEDFQYSSVDSMEYYFHMADSLSSQARYEPGKADILRLKGILLFNKGKYDEGALSAYAALNRLYQLLPDHEKKLAASSQTPYEKKLLLKIADAANTVAQNRIAEAKYAEGLRVSMQVLKIRERLGPLKGLADVEFNIGLIHFAQLNYTESLEHHQASLRAAEKLGNKSYMSTSYTSIAAIYLERNELREAAENFNRALEFAKASGDKYALAEAYGHLGQLEEKRGHYPLSLSYSHAALQLYLEMGINFQYGYIFNNLARAHMQVLRYDSAEYYLAKSRTASSETGHLEYLKQAYEDWSRLDSLKGNYRQSLDHYKNYIRIRDSLLSKETDRKLVETKMQYRFDREQDSLQLEQAKKDVIAQQKVRRQRTLRNASLGGLALVLFFTGLVLRQRNKVKAEKRKSDALLLNILPVETAEELKATGAAVPCDFEQVTVLFTDFKDFTQASEKMSAQELVREINRHFSEFDRIISNYKIEKIKTIGDSYMAAGGLPVPSASHAIDTLQAALEIRDYMQEQQEKNRLAGKPVFSIRIGLHSGPVVAGIVGTKKFAYDIWGDTVNIASRMESSGEPGKVNISGATYELVRGKFNCRYRGKIPAKHKGEIEMYFVETGNTEPA